ncbi:MAG: ribonuclease HII [bacterium]
MKALLDKKLWKKHSHLAGVDEAGRGPLAGPVVAAAVILERNFYDSEIDDSKKLSPAKREKLYALITNIALSYSFGIVESEIIDEINILNATKRAMRQAIDGLKIFPNLVLIDAVTITDLPFRQISIIKGDTLSLSIAAASILAKVKRDTIMQKYHKLYPMYQFNKHKGYPTKLHRQCIKEHGPCPIHRKTFRLLGHE